MSEVINFAKSRHEREIKELGEKLGKIADELFTIFGREGLTILEAEQFTQLVLPAVLKERIGKHLAKIQAQEILSDLIAK